jgi:mRNA interferase MazF
LRLPIEPSDENNLRAASRVMVDRITTVRRSRLGRRVGRLSDEDLTRVNRAIVVFLGLANTASR